jgi:hypothetical protein
MRVSAASGAASGAGFAASLTTAAYSPESCFGSAAGGVALEWERVGAHDGQLVAGRARARNRDILRAAAMMRTASCGPRQWWRTCPPAQAACRRRCHTRSFLLKPTRSAGRQCVPSRPACLPSRGARHLFLTTVRAETKHGPPAHACLPRTFSRQLHTFSSGTLTAGNNLGENRGRMNNGERCVRNVTFKSRPRCYSSLCPASVRVLQVCGGGKVSRPSS